MMQIFFVFDTTFCKSDEDDPKDALVYFYPLEMCDTQRCELCFQLVGVSQFLKSTFSSPSMISLDQGRFALYQSQSYLLVLGSNSVDGIILKEQLLYLYRAFAFCFKDMNLVLKVCGNNRVLFMQKVKEMWNQVLLASKLFGNIMHVASGIPSMMVLSQKNSSVVCSKARQLLHSCQRNSPVIAGAIFCDELLAYSQLTPELTRNLMLLLSFKDLAVLQSTPVAYRLPPGVKMKSVYLTRKEISDVLKRNHMNVGTPIRYQSHKKTHTSTSGTAGLSSGSEGDVDSGNSSEGTETQKSDTSVRSGFDSQSQAKTLRSLPSTSDMLEACSSPVCNPDHTKKILNKKFERCISTETERSYSTAYESSPGILFYHCRRHSQYLAFTDNSSWRHTTLQRSHSFSCSYYDRSNTAVFKEGRTCDSELCLHSISFRSPKGAVRCDLSTSAGQRTTHFVHNLRTEYCYLCLIKNHDLADEFMHKGVEKKLQILKCRLSKRRSKNYGRNVRTPRSSIDQNSPVVCNSRMIAATVPTTKTENSSALDNLTNSSNRQEVFLYIQRYCDCTLFLLLNSTFDEDLLSNLWMYGFSGLGELELEMKRYMLSINNSKRNDFQICVLDTIQHEMPGKLPSTEDNSKDTVIQGMHVDFQSNRSLHSVSLVLQNRCLVGCSVQQREIYYMQPGTINANAEMHREPFTQLYRKAYHRIKKYFGISVSDF